MAHDPSLVTSYISAIKAHTIAQNTLKSTHADLQVHKKIHEKSESDVEAIQTVGLIVAEILQQLSSTTFIVKSSQGPRYVVGMQKEVLERFVAESSLCDEKHKKKTSNAKKDEKFQRINVVGVRVALDVTTLTIMHILPREVDPTIHKMSREDPGAIDFTHIGGLADQIRELREVVEKPLKNPELFVKLGINPPKGVLLYGPPGTGKTLLARVLASTLDVTFLKIVASSIIEKYIGESSRLIREMFNYARDCQPCIIFMDEIDAIGSKRSSESSSSDREVQRTLMELLAQMDGFDALDQVKIVMATNRPDILDEALLRPGRLDRKVEIPLPNEQGRREILRIHSKKMRNSSMLTQEGSDNANTAKSLVGESGAMSMETMELVVSLSKDFNGADLRNVCTEAGMCAIRDERDYVKDDDFVKAVRKIADVKKLESKMHYKKKQ